jgi:HEAT repeat protein
MSLELALGGSLLLAGLWFASTALFPGGPQARALSGAGGALSRGVRGIFADPAPAPAAFVYTAGRPGTAVPPAGARLAGVATASGGAVEVGGDPALAVTLQQTLTVLEEVLAQLPALLAKAEEGGRGDQSGSRRPVGAGSSPVNLTVSRLVGESLPPALARNEGFPASPFFTRLFELCEEELDVADDEPAPRPVVAARVPPPPAEPDPGRFGNDGPTTAEATELPDDLSEGTPMSNPNDPPSSDLAYPRGEISADVAAEMFEVAMTALAQALVDDERAVREASVRALGGIDPGAIRRWASVKLLTGDADDMAAGARIVDALELDEVVGEVLERALEAGAPQRDRAVGALRALAPSAELLERTVARVGEGQRARLPALLPELFEGPALAGMLQVLVRDPSEQVRMASLDALAAHADRDTVLRVASNVIAVDQSAAVRVVAADLLGRAGTSAPRRTEAADTEPEEAPAAILPEDPAALWELLLAHVGRGDDDVIAEAAEHARDTLMAAALAHADDADPSARALAVRAALRAGTEDGVVIAMLALADPDPQVRRAAVEVCRRTDGAEATTALRRLVTDPDHEVRKVAVTALVGSEEPEATASVVRALADPEEDIRTLAQAALLGRTTPEVARLLVDELEDPGGRQAAATILRGMGDTGRQAVEQAMPSLSREAIVAAGTVLAAVPGSADRYLADLSSLDARARLRAVRALGAIGGQQAVTALVGRLHDPVDEIRIEALDHLGRIAGADVVPLLRRIRAGDPIPAVGAAAERAVNLVLERADGA